MTEKIFSIPNVFSKGGQGQRFSHTNSNFNRKMHSFLQIPLSWLILQIIGRKKINGHIRKIGLDQFKGKSVIKTNSNLVYMYVNVVHGMLF